ncbi:uncharacterized protein M6B38_147525 [Iris pallida]|uniref:FYVE-type domain-containing protein n=1 Tax=Iris pallida TaxID=29817 RepID=A0AAX6F7K4_IRIPA|nr:uncharacterized protein M6B38_147525 [Iris pallida]
MATPKGGIVLYSSLSKPGNQIHSDENYKYTFSGGIGTSDCSSGPSTSSLDRQYPLPADSYYPDGYDSGEDTYIPTQSRRQPEVNLTNVLGGILAILTGRNKGLASIQHQEDFGSCVSFLGSDSNGETVLHSSVCIPSAPPLLEPVVDYSAYKRVLEAEPPEWQADSSSTSCMLCYAHFTALTRGRHHCRFCGGIFCRACTKGRCLMPIKFRMRDPQRVCSECYKQLEPLQGVLKNSISNASQSAKHDVVDWTCGRGWLNFPVGLSMEHEIYKAVNTLRSYCQVARLHPEKSIPRAILNGASGLAILTVAKVGAFFTYKLGTGLVVSRMSDGSWSAPSAILSIGLGWGAQVGAELMDFIIVLHGLETVKTFSSQMHFSLGAGMSAAAGPVGRVFEADLCAGDRGSGMCYTYSCSKGAFVGVSMEGNVVVTRMDTNLRFYGDPYLSTSDILLGMVGRPKAAEPLYSALDDLYAKFDI